MLYEVITARIRESPFSPPRFSTARRRGSSRRPATTTFANTIEALERSGAMYTRVSRVFGAVNGAHTNDTLQDVARTLASYNFV